VDPEKNSPEETVRYSLVGGSSVGVQTEAAAWGEEEMLSNLMRNSRSSKEEGQTTQEAGGKSGRKDADRKGRERQIKQVHVSPDQAVDTKYH